MRERIPPTVLVFVSGCWIAFTETHRPRWFSFRTLVGRDKIGHDEAKTGEMSCQPSRATPLSPRYDAGVGKKNKRGEGGNG
jgi:hypothetical protein